MPTANAPDGVIRLYERLLDAWNARDADAFGALFGDDGTSIGFDGSEMHGREEIAATLRDIFAHHQTARYVAIVRQRRALADGVTLLRAAAGMVARDSGGLNPAVNAIQSLVAVADGDALRIALFQNTPAAYHGRPQLAAALTAELEGVAREQRTLRDDTR